MAPESCSTYPEDELRVLLRAMSENVEYRPRDVVDELERKAQARTDKRTWLLSVVVATATVVNVIVGIVVWRA